MARPKEFEDLTTTSLTVGRKQLKEARDRGLNLSDLLRGALAGALRTPAKKAKEKQLVSRIKKKIKGIPVRFVNRNLGIVADNPARADKQASFMNVRCNTELTGEDLMALIPRY